MKITRYILLLLLIPYTLFAQDPMEYNGDWQFNKRNGQGKMIYYDGSVYNGLWQNNIRQGQGSMTFQNGESYVGSWVNGKIEGNGAYSFKNGEKFEGQFANGLPHGKGTYTLKSGDIYSGEISQGIISGQGQMTFASGDQYNGGFSDGKMMGSGNMNYTTGDIYKGEWSNNKREGYGVQNFANGDVYDGSWKNDKMFGIGVLNKANGEKYVGEFNKEYSGMGRLTTANGDYIEGDFKNGIVDGNATIWYDNGEQYKGEVKKGFPDGNGTYFYNDDSYYTGELKRGKPDGMGKLCDASGEMMKGGKWSKGGLKKTYEQIDAGRKAFAEGMQALAQGMAVAGQQMQTQNAQMKANAAANKAKWDNYMRESKQSQDTYNNLYQEELNKMNSNPYSKNNPMKEMEAKVLASQRMKQMKQTQSNSGTSNINGNRGASQSQTSYNIGGSGYGGSSNYSKSNTQPQQQAQTRVKTISETTLIKKYYKDNPHQLSRQYWAKNDEQGEVITPHIEHGFYQSWHKNGKKQIECYFTNGEYDGEYKFWNKNGQIEEFCTHKSSSNNKASIDINWAWKNNALESVYLENLRAGDENGDGRSIYDLSYDLKNQSYNYHDEIRHMEYKPKSGRIKTYKDDEISFFDDIHAQGIKSKSYYYKNKCVWYIQHNNQGSIDFISSYYIHANYLPEPEYDWGSIIYDKEGKEHKHINNQSKYDNSLRLKKMISTVSRKNADDIIALINQLRPMMDSNRYK